jgi:hypothetical protein
MNSIKQDTAHTAGIRQYASRSHFATQQTI